MKLLVADDEPTIRQVIADGFGQGGFQMIEARDGDEAVALALVELPDLILLDVSMPRLDGFEALRQLQAYEQTRDIPVIFLSAYSDSERMTYGLDIGAAAFVRKPFHLEELFSRVVQILLQQTHERLNTERRALNEAKRRGEQLKRALDQVGRALTAGVSLEATLGVIVDSVTQLTTSQGCLVLLLARDQCAFRVAAARGIDLDSLIGLQMTVENTLDGQVIRSQRSQSLADRERQPGLLFPRLLGGQEPQTQLSAPLGVDNRITGTITIYSASAHAFGENDLQLLDSFAGQAAIAIERARLRQESDSRAEELAALHEISVGISAQLDLSKLLKAIVRSATQLLHARSGAIALLDEREGTLRYAATYNLGEVFGDLVMRLGEGLTGLVAERAEPMVVNDYARFEGRLEALEGENVSAVVSAPLLWEGRVIGVIHVLDDAQDRMFQEPDRDLLVRFCAQAAVAIQNARLVREVAQIEALRQADRLKSEFVQTVSHELRTPLASIKGHATTLLRRDWDDAARRECLGIIDSEADRLHELINDLLDMSKIEAGELRLIRERLALSPLIRRVVEGMRDRSTSHRFLRRIPREVPRVNADPRRMEQVLRNLLENSVKYAPEGGRILIDVATQDHEVTVSISDEGVGIPGADLERIFERFHRIDNPLTRNVGGTGLGLAICRGIIGAHGGRIWAESPTHRANGRRRPGTTIRFSLPVVEEGESS